LASSARTSSIIVDHRWPLSNERELAMLAELRGADLQAVEQGLLHGDLSESQVGRI
jgi:hypothetical protein